MTSFVSKAPTIQNEVADTERYGIIHHYLEVEVRDPQIKGSGSKKFVDYEIVIETNLPMFMLANSSVRRRYSDFRYFEKALGYESNSRRTNIPTLPGKLYFNQFSDSLIEARRQGLERFVKRVASDPYLQLGSDILVIFLQDPEFVRPAFIDY